MKLLILILILFPIFSFGQTNSNEFIFPKMNDYTYYKSKKLKKIAKYHCLKVSEVCIYVSKNPLTINKKNYYLVNINGNEVSVTETYLEFNGDTIYVDSISKDSIIFSKKIFINFKTPSKKDTLEVNGLGGLTCHKMYFDTIIYSKKYDSVYVYKLSRIIHGWYKKNGKLWLDKESSEPDNYYEIAFSKEFGIVSVTKESGGFICYYTPKKKLNRKELARLGGFKYAQEYLNIKR